MRHQLLSGASATEGSRHVLAQIANHSAYKLRQHFKPWLSAAARRRCRVHPLHSPLCPGPASRQRRAAHRAHRARPARRQRVVATATALWSVSLALGRSLVRMFPRGASHQNTRSTTQSSDPARRRIRLYRCLSPRARRRPRLQQCALLSNASGPLWWSIKCVRPKAPTRPDNVHQRHCSWFHSYKLVVGRFPICSPVFYTLAASDDSLSSPLRYPLDVTERDVVAHNTFPGVHGLPPPTAGHALGPHHPQHLPLPPHRTCRYQLPERFCQRRRALWSLGILHLGR